MSAPSRGAHVSRSAPPLPPTQLLLRNIDRFAGENLLLMGVPRDDSVLATFGGRHGSLVTLDYGSHLLHSSLLSVSGAKLRPVFSANYEPSGPAHDIAIVYLQKGGDFNDLLLAIVAHAVQPGAKVFLVGENKAGIRSNADVLERRIGPITFSDAARHCVIYEASLSAEVRTRADLHLWERAFVVDAASHRLNIVSLPGVFSHGRLDEGTAFLLNHLPADLRGAVLDFGCGTGVVGAVVKALYPEDELTLVDSNALALEATALTFASNALSAKAIQPADVFTGVQGTFDVIISNPPFHEGIATNYEIVSSFMTSCNRYLRPGGQLVIVANRFLPYEPLMAKAMGAPTLIAQSKKYKVLVSRKRL